MCPRQLLGLDEQIYECSMALSHDPSVADTEHTPILCVADASKEQSEQSALE